MQVSISSKTTPLPQAQTPRTRLEGSKNPPSGIIIVYKTLPSKQNRESKAQPLGHKVIKFHKYIYKLWYYLKWKALWSQQIKKVFQWGDWLLKFISFGGHQSQTIERMNLYTICINVFCSPSEKKGLETFQKDISNFYRFLPSFFYS